MMIITKCVTFHDDNNKMVFSLKMSHSHQGKVSYKLLKAVNRTIRGKFSM